MEGAGGAAATNEHDAAHDAHDAAHDDGNDDDNDNGRRPARRPRGIPHGRLAVVSHRRWVPARVSDPRAYMWA